MTVVYVLIGLVILVLFGIACGPYLTRVAVNQAIREGRITVEEGRQVLYGKKEPHLVDMSIDLGDE